MIDDISKGRIAPYFFLSGATLLVKSETEKAILDAVIAFTKTMIGLDILRRFP